MTPKEKLDSAVTEARAQVAAASKTRNDAQRAFDKAEKAYWKAHNRLGTLLHRRQVAAQRKADLAGKNGPLVVLTSTPQTLFEKTQTAKFVITSVSWLLDDGCRCCMRRVGSMSCGLFIDVDAGTKAVTLRERRPGKKVVTYHLDRTKLSEMLTAVYEHKSADRPLGMVWAGKALRHLKAPEKPSDEDRVVP